MIDKRLSCKDEWSVYTKLFLMINGDTCECCYGALEKECFSYMISVYPSEDE